MVTRLLASTTCPVTVPDAPLKVSRFWLPALSLNLPAATPMVAVPVLPDVGVKVAV